MLKVRKRKIKERTILAGHGYGLILTGWLDGECSYLWIGNIKGEFVGIIEGQPLYRLCKAIVRQFDASRGKEE